MDLADGQDRRAQTWADLLADGRLPRFALICLGVWLNAADSLVTATIMPSVGRELGGYAYFSWATAGYLVGAILAGACVLAAPAVALFIAFQRKFISTDLGSGVKG